MSLINDALRQAKQANPASVTADGPVLHAVGTTPSSRRSGEFWGVLLLGVLLTLGVMFVWQSFSSGQAAHLPLNKAAARVSAPPTVTPPATPVPEATPTVVHSTSPQAPTAPVKTVETVATMPAAPETATSEPAKPEAPIYKLQSVVYRARNPFALINGKDVTIGSKVGEATVVAIGQASVTLLDSAGQTNVLEVKIH